MNYEELSKEISYALRHAPWKYELEMDENGWVPVEQLLDVLKKTERWNSICAEDLGRMIEKSEKKRYEIKDGNIRAFYGHSLPMKILKEEKIPPNILYHGTARRFLKSIIENGLWISQDLDKVDTIKQQTVTVHLKHLTQIGKRTGKGLESTRPQR